MTGKLLRKNYKQVRCEGQLVLTETWEETSFGIWTGPEACWLFLKLDVEHPSFEEDDVMVVIDYKTGKMRPNHEEQLELYALGMFCKYEDCAAVDSAMWYLDSGETMERRYSRKLDYKRLLKKWSKAPKKMMADRTFKPDPTSWMCRYCDFAAGRGGQCKYGPSKAEVKAIEAKKKKTSTKKKPAKKRVAKKATKKTTKKKVVRRRTA